MSFLPMLPLHTVKRPQAHCTVNLRAYMLSRNGTVCRKYFLIVFLIIIGKNCTLLIAKGLTKSLFGVTIKMINKLVEKYLVAADTGLFFHVQKSVPCRVSERVQRKAWRCCCACTGKLRFLACPPPIPASGQPAEYAALLNGNKWTVNYVSPDGYKPGQWLRSQKQRRENNMLEAYKAAMLAEIGLVFEGPQ